MATSKLISSPKKTAHKRGHSAKLPTTVRVSSKSSDPAIKPKSASSSSAPSKGVKAGASKQSAVLAMLRKPGGATIGGIMKIPDWQAHWVRGFFAGTVRWKLGLNLVSDKLGAD